MANEAMTGLVNGSALTPLLTEAMGAFTPPVVAQVGPSDARCSRLHPTLCVLSVREYWCTESLRKSGVITQ